MTPLKSILALVSGAVFAAAPLAVATAQATADVLIRGGMLVDGTGAAPRRADVAIRGDRIVFVGDASQARLRATRTVDAAGLVVAPGFIDPHTHALEDLLSAARRGNVNYLMQGVTTVITGNDGGGPLDVGRTLAQWNRDGIGTNAALLVGQGTVRRRVLGMESRAPNAAELDSMRRLVGTAMTEGALGMSTGLYYAPGSYANTDEVVELARVAARHGGVYDSHLRDESSYTVGLLGAVTEAIRIAREARIPVNISHIKALGADVWGQSDTVIALIKAARAEGLDVTADQYPYTASGTGLGAALLPRWAEAGGRDSLVARIDDPATRARLVRDMTENLRRRGGAEALLITSSRDATIKGRTLAQIAAQRGTSPIDAALTVIRGGDASVASFNMQDADIERFMVQDFVSTGSDGSGGHPRKYGTFPKKLREYVFTKHLLSLADAIEASSARTARAFGIADRGVVREGAFADVIVFDTATVADRATYEEPEQLATGMRFVLVNGKFAVDGGKATGAMAGRGLKRAAPPTIRHRASARLTTADGKPAGTVELTEDAAGRVTVTANVTNLSPGAHGIHFHAVGVCTAAGETPFASAAGHFNPVGRKHGLESPAGAHAGDLPNLVVAADGTGRLTTTVTRATLSAGPRSLLDADRSAVVIHAGPDDHRTDPAGNSGARVACGVIGGR